MTLEGNKIKKAKTDINSNLVEETTEHMESNTIEKLRHDSIDAQNENLNSSPHLESGMKIEMEPGSMDEDESTREVEKPGSELDAFAAKALSLNGEVYKKITEAIIEKVLKKVDVLQRKVLHEPLKGEIDEIRCMLKVFDEKASYSTQSTK